MYVACSADPYLQDLHRCVSLACSWGTHHHGQAYTAQNSNGAAQQRRSTATAQQKESGSDRTSTVLTAVFGGSL
jgi:hypothetical protein